MSRLRRGGAALAGVLLLVSGAPAQEDPVPVGSEDDGPALVDLPVEAVSENDPLEPVNRVVFELNRRVLWYTARPIAKAWEFVIPRPVREGLHNSLENLNSPLVFGNQVLQGDAGAATRTFARVVVNSTVGIGGAIDVAWRLGIPKRNTDLGLTLGAFGVGEGPYLVLPLLGPAMPRDSVASFAQGLGDPFNLWVQNTDYAFYAFLVRFVLGNIDLYARRMDELDRIEESSVDFYAALRNLYRQKRRADVRAIRAEAPPAPVGIDYTLDLEDDDSEAPSESADPASDAP